MVLRAPGGSLAIAQGWAQRMMLSTTRNRGPVKKDTGQKSSGTLSLMIRCWKTGIQHVSGVLIRDFPGVP